MGTRLRIQRRQLEGRIRSCGSAIEGEGMMYRFSVILLLCMTACAHPVRPQLLRVGDAVHGCTVWEVDALTIRDLRIATQRICQNDGDCKFRWLDSAGFFEVTRCINIVTP